MLKILRNKLPEWLLSLKLPVRQWFLVLGAGLLLLLGLQAQAQTMSGAYTVNAALPSGGTNFVSFTELANRLNLSGVTGPVTITVTGGPYTEQLALGTVPGASATNTVVINGGGSTLQFASTNTNQRAVVLLNATYYVTINNLVINATGGTYGYGIQLTNNANYDFITNNTVNADITTTSGNFAGIVVSGSTSNATAMGDTGSNLTIEGNTVNGGTYGISLIGGSATSLNTGNIVRNNNVRDFYFYGIYTSYQDGAQFIGNDIARPLRTNGSSFFGIYASGASRSLAIERNRLHDAFAGNPTATAGIYGIYLITSTAATVTTPNDIVNNVLYNLSGSGTQYLIYSASSDYSRIYNNTINSDNQATTTTANTYGIYSSGLRAEIQNNVVSITRSGTGAKYGIYAVTNAPNSNYNDLYVPTGNVGYYSTVTYATLASWQAANGGTFDQNSVSANPLFAGAGTGNLLPGNVLLNNAGIPLARVTTDITGAPRGVAPDLGAYEFTPVAVDLTPVGLASPAVVSSCYGPAEAITVQVRNGGTSPLNFAINPATATVVVTPPSGPTQTFTGTLSTGTLASGATQNFTLTGTLDMSALGTYGFAVTATVAGDLNPGNDLLVPAATRTAVAPVAGTLAATPAAICFSGTAVLTLAGSANGSLQYQSSPSATGTFTDIAGATAATFTTPVLTSTAYYRVRVTCNANTAYSNVVTITVNAPQVATTNAPLSGCAGSAVTLTATANAGSAVRFFTTATGGTALASSTAGAYTTPALTTSATYYAEAFTSGLDNVGKPSSTGTDGTSTGGGLYFTATGSTTIISVTVYRSASAAVGTATIYLLPGSPSSITTAVLATALTSATVAVPANTAAAVAPAVLPLGFAVPTAGAYTLYLGAATPGLVRDYTGSTAMPATAFPYNSPSGLVSITNGTIAGYYYYFYNWQISTECAATMRTPIQVNVTTVLAALTASTSAGGGTLLTAAPVAGATYQFFRNGTAVAAASTTNTLLLQSASLNGSYTVVVTSNGCTSVPSAAVAVTVTGTRTATLSGVSLLVYPSPTPDGRLTLELTGPQAKASQLDVLNSLGQSVQRYMLIPGTVTLSLADLAPGIYVLRVQTALGMLTQRVVRE